MSVLIISPGPVTRITLNRPDVRNALNEALIDALTEWAAGVQAGGDVRLAVLEGAGPAFCAGADLDWMRRMAGFSRDENIADAARAARMFDALDALPIPLIGRIHGAAIGGGVGLAAVCDIVIAAKDATFALSETTLGLVPAMISPYLVRKMGLSATRALALHGQRFDVRQAQRAGLVHYVASIANLESVVEEMVGRFSTASPQATAATKALLRRVAMHEPSDVQAMTAAAIADARASADGQEGIQAFFERRQPKWSRPLLVPPRDE